MDPVGAPPRRAQNPTQAAPSNTPAHSSDTTSSSERLSTREDLDRELVKWDHYHINLSSLLIFPKAIGKGHFGVVREGRLTQVNNGSTTTIAVAVKELPSHEDDNLKIALRLVREMKIWSETNHRNILPFIGFHLSADLDVALLISPFEPLGDVIKYNATNNPHLDERLELASGAVCGVKYLHHNGICHGDIKGINTLVRVESGQRRTLLCDLGLARILENPTRLTSSDAINNGTCWWCSPEILKNGQKTKEGDIWAVGCLIIEIILGFRPYRDLGNYHMMYRAAVKDKKPPEPVESLAAPVDLQWIVSACWSYDPKKRMDAKTCYAMFQHTRFSRFAKAVEGTVFPTTESRFFRRPPPPENLKDLRKALDGVLRMSSKASMEEEVSKLEALVTELDQQGENDEADGMYSLSKAILEDLVEDAPHSHRTTLAQSLLDRGERLFLRERDQAARELLSESVRTWRDVTTGEPAGGSGRFQLGRALYCLGRSIYAISGAEDAIEVFKEASHICHDLGQGIDSKRAVGAVLGEVGQCQYDLKLYSEAAVTLEETVKIRNDILATEPESNQVKSLVKALWTLAKTYEGLERNHDEVMARERVVVHLRNLVQQQGQDGEREDLFRSLLALGSKLYKLSRVSYGVSMMQEALQICRNLAEEDPERFTKTLSECLYHVADRLSKQSGKERAIHLLEEGVAVTRSLAQSNSDEEWRLFHALYRLGRYLHLAGHNEKALGMLREATSIRRSLDTGSSVPRLVESLADSLHELGEVQSKLELWSESRKSQEEAVELYRRRSEEAERVLLACSLDGLGFSLYHMGGYEESVEVLQEAVRQFKAVLVWDTPKERASLLANAAHIQGLCLYKLARNPHGLSSFDEAIRRRRDGVAGPPACYSSDLADSHHWRGRSLLMLRRNQDALQALEEAVRIRRIQYCEDPHKHAASLADFLSWVFETFIKLGLNLRRNSQAVWKEVYELRTLHE